MELHVTAGPGSTGFLAETRGRAGFARLAPSAPNERLPGQLWSALGDKVDAWGRDPNVYCAVVDGAFGAGMEALVDQDAQAAAYQGIWRLDRFGKPCIALITQDAAWDTISGLLNATHKVADPAVGFTFTDVAEGRVPVWGASFHLAALPGKLGLYLAMTGAKLDSAMAYRLGWLTHRIAASRFTAIKERLADADPVDPMLDDIDEGAGTPALAPHLAAIERCFSAASPQDILSRLDAASGADLAWAEPAAAAMRGADKAVLAATHRLLTSHPQPDLRSGLRLDLRVAVNGLKALPDPAGPDALFAPLPGGEPEFADPPPPSIV